MSLMTYLLRTIRYFSLPGRLLSVLMAISAAPLSLGVGHCMPLTECEGCIGAPGHFDAARRFQLLLWTKGLRVPGFCAGSSQFA